MKPVFADSFFYLALLNPADEYHASAVAATRDFKNDTVTTEFVLLEVADGLARTRLRRLAAQLWDTIADGQTTIIEAGPQLLRDALALYRRRRDKTWSLTDCTSFVVMRQRKLDDALTGDRHFVQAGFRALLTTPRNK